MTRITTNMIVGYLRSYPRSTSRDIGQAFGYPETCASSTLVVMHQKGLVTRKRAGRYFQYTLADAPKPAEAGTELETLKARLAELEKWREETLTSHPELAPKPPVEPIVLKAREIVARINREEGHTTFADGALAGDHDMDIEMLIALACLGDGNP